MLEYGRQGPCGRGVAKTGSGKTAAFLLPALVHVMGEACPRTPWAVIIHGVSPTGCHPRDVIHGVSSTGYHPPDVIHVVSFTSFGVNDHNLVHTYGTNGLTHGSA